MKTKWNKIIKDMYGDKIMKEIKDIFDNMSVKEFEETLKIEFGKAEKEIFDKIETFKDPNNYEVIDKLLNYIGRAD